MLASHLRLTVSNWSLTLRFSSINTSYAHLISGMSAAGLSRRIPSTLSRWWYLVKSKSQIMILLWFPLTVLLYYCFLVLDLVIIGSFLSIKNRSVSKDGQIVNRSVFRIEQNRCLFLPEVEGRSILWSAVTSKTFKTLSADSG
jgi:hypothetical protein